MTSVISEKTISNLVFTGFLVFSLNPIHLTPSDPHGAPTGNRSARWQRARHRRHPGRPWAVEARCRAHPVQDWFGAPAGLVSLLVTANSPGE